MLCPEGLPTERLERVHQLGVLKLVGNRNTLMMSDAIPTRWSSFCNLVCSCSN